jgi:hypothetical protein
MRENATTSAWSVSGCTTRGARSAAEPTGALSLADEYPRMLLHVAVFDPDRLAVLESVSGLAHRVRLAAESPVIEDDDSFLTGLPRAQTTSGRASAPGGLVPGAQRKRDRTHGEREALCPH